MTRKRKTYLGPDVPSCATIPRTSSWRYKSAESHVMNPVGSAGCSSQAGDEQPEAAGSVEQEEDESTSDLQSEVHQAAGSVEQEEDESTSDLQSEVHQSAASRSRAVSQAAASPLSSSANSSRAHTITEFSPERASIAASRAYSLHSSPGNSFSAHSSPEHGSLGPSLSPRSSEGDGSVGDEESGPEEEREVPPEPLAQDHQPSHPKLRRKMQGEFEPIIETAVNVSRNDALYMALGLARRENFSNSTFCNAVQLINALFGASVLPSTLDVLDSLLVSNIGVKYFFYCHSCSQAFGTLNHKLFKSHVCPNCNTLNVISDLRVAHFFVMFSIPHQLENLLQNNDIFNALVTPAEAVGKSRNGIISDIWDGTIYKNFAAAVRHHLCRIFSFHFSVDGSPLSVSSLCSIWPILLVLNELPPELRMSHLLLGGLWFGKKQPNMGLFLEPFVNHFRVLSEGFNITIRDVVERAMAFCIGCCADSGARGKVQGIKTHSGYHSCNWCEIRGEWISGAVRFPLRMERPRERTHQAVVEAQHLLINNPPPVQEDDIDEDASDPGIPEYDQHLLGVNAVSPLINMPFLIDEEGNRIPSFNMVSSFFVDTMHMVDLGLCKFFLARWLEDFGHNSYIKESSEEIDRRISSLRPPLEFRKLPRKLHERARFSARECYNLLMFCIFPALKGIQRDKYLKVWLLLIQALYLLTQTEVTFEDLDLADTLINLFLIQTQECYDTMDMTFNLHILKHLVSHTLLHGPSWTTNAYCFEDGNGKLKKVIHSNQGIPHQVIRALSWGESFKILEGVVSQKAKDYVKNISATAHQKQRSVSAGSARLIGRPQTFELSIEERFECENHGHAEENLERYTKVIYKGCAFTDNCERSSRYNNSVAQLNDRKIVLIRKIFLDSDQNQVFLLVSEVNFETVLTLPAGVNLDRDKHFMRKITTIDEELLYVKCSDLKIICFVASMPDGEFLAPFPNVHNRH